LTPIGLPALSGIFFVLILGEWFSLAQACRIEEPEFQSSTILHRHLVGPCTSEEREALAISGEELLRALKEGKSIDILGLVVIGDLLLDRLPLYPIEHHHISSPRIRKTLKEHGIAEVRVIPGSLTIRESWVQGILATNLTKGALVIFGELDMVGTKFQKSVDFSRTVFLNPVNFSDTKIAFEGFFIRSHFDKEAMFQNTAFGTHSRFHKAFFGGKASFHQAGFHGLAEFLEVMFEDEANFSQTLFKLGTGFSGTQFRGILDFSHALFEREAYFRFTTFEKQASFRGTTFHRTADFTNIQFKENPDFTHAVFKVTPTVSDSRLNLGNQRVGNLQDRTIQIVIFVGLFLLVLFLIWASRRR